MKKLSSLFFILLSFLVISCSNLVSDTGSIRFVLPEDESNSRGVLPKNNDVGQSYVYLITYTKVQDADFDYEDSLDSLNPSYMFGKSGEEVVINNLPQGLYFLYVGAFKDTVEEALKDVVREFGIQTDYKECEGLEDIIGQNSPDDFKPIYKGSDVATVMAGRNNEFELTLEWQN